MKFKIAIVFSAFTFFTLGAQDFKFKDVPKSELEERYHPMDSAAPAAVLYEKGELTMKYENGFMYELKTTKRVKIYNNDGFDYATIRIPYYVGESSSSSENIKNIKAYVYNLEGNKIEDEKLKNRDIVEENLSEFWNQVKFTLPNLKPGTVIEYTYVYESPHISELPKWYFQGEIPVNYSEYTLTIPEMIGYSERPRGFHNLQRSVENISTNISISSSNSTARSSSGLGETKAVRYSYIARDVPKLKDEPFVNNLSNYITSVKHEMAYSRFGNGEIKQYSTTWPEVAKTLQDSEFFGEQLDDTNYFKEDIDPIISSSQNKEEVMLNIFNFVKKNIKWNDYNGIYASEKLRKIYKEKTGNIADVNLMLTSMLRYAGIEAHPVLISTIDHGLPSNFVSRKDYNYIIVSVEQNNTTTLLDASSKYSSPNILPIRCLNNNGRVIKPNGATKQISLMPKEKSKDNFVLKLDLDENGNVEGKMRRQYTSHLGYLYRTRFTEIEKEEYIEKKENDYNIEINEYTNKNVEELDSPVVETMSFTKVNAADVINDNIYISPLLFLAQEENPFKLDNEDRKLPIDFTFPFSNRYMVNISVPEGYKIDYLPEPAAVALPDKKAMFRYIIQETPDHNIQVIVSEDINVAFLPAEYYSPLKDYFNQIVNKETDKIVLVKSE